MKQLSSFRSTSALGLSLLVFAVVVGACGVDSPTGETAPGAGVASSSAGQTAEMVESDDARHLVDSLRTRFQFRTDEQTDLRRPDRQRPSSVPMMRESVATTVRRDGDRLHPAIPENALRGIAHPAKVVLPLRASNAFELTDQTSHLGASVRLVDATNAEAEVTGGVVTYRRGHASGADVLHRPTAEGTEDFLYFEKAPTDAALVYEVALGEGVAGVRLVERTLELLDAGGTPRLRMAAPYWMDAKGTRHEARVEVSGCAYDSDPRGPWERPVTAPGSSACRVRVSWEADGVAYPLLVDPSWVTCGNLNGNRDEHVAAVLDNGKVLVAGGYANGNYLSTAELFDPSSRTWSSTASLSTPRDYAAGTILPGGTTVLVAGGSSSGSSSLASAERYDRSTGTWTLLANSMSAARYSASATLININNNNKVLIVGGSNSSGYLASAEYFDPTALTFSPTGAMSVGRIEHRALLLPNQNKVLVVGGHVSGYVPTPLVHLFDPAGTGTWTTVANTPIGGEYSNASVLPSGKVLMTGGKFGNYSNASAIFDPVTLSWTSAPNMSEPRANHFQIKLSNGAVLVAGGYGSPTYPTSAELYSEANNTWTATASLNFNQSEGSSSLLQDGRVLLAGGGSGCCYTSISQLYVATSNGVSCNSFADCGSGFCVDGVCCNSTCNSLCQACNVSGSVGTCTNFTANTDPYNECPTECNGAGACEAANGTACTLASQCQSGNCVDNYCCNSACSSLCQACNVSNNIGTCTNVPLNQDDGTCTGTTQSCNGLGECKKEQGQSCSNTSDCLNSTNVCVDGVCCENACLSTCWACSSAKKGGGDNGLCRPIFAGNSPRDPINDCNDGSVTCGWTGKCDGTGACQNAPQGLACGATTSCSNNQVIGKSCDGAGKCVDNQSGTPCAPATCSGTTCGTTCSNDANCTADGFCDTDSKCKFDLSNGAACTKSSACKSGYCVDGFCCNSPCDGFCEACSQSKRGSGNNGACGYVKAGTDPDNECSANATSTCQQNGQCNGQGVCALWDATTSCGVTLCYGNIEKKQLCSGLGVCGVETGGKDCGLYACVTANGTGACKTSCVTNQDCIPSAYCASATSTCEPDKELGSSCSTTSECRSGYCVDGVCCDSPCVGTCRICAGPLNSAGQDGICGNIFAGQDPADECNDDGVDSCKKNGFCDGNGACQLYSAGTSCKTPACADDSVVRYECSGAGSCIQKLPVEDCFPYACKQGNCIPNGTCNVDADCASDAYCVTPQGGSGGAGGMGGSGGGVEPLGSCVSKKNLAATCGVSGECTSGHCVDGVCCDTACTGTCQACNKPGSEGSCASAPEGTDDSACAPDPENPCGFTGQCTSAGICEIQAYGAICSDTQATCTNGINYTAKICNGFGSCVNDPSTIEPCFPYTCGDGGTSCKTSCTQPTEAADCVSGYSCQAGVCTPNKTCVTKDDCESNQDCDPNTKKCIPYVVPTAVAESCDCQVPGQSSSSSSSPWSALGIAFAFGLLRRVRSRKTNPPHRFVV